MHRSPEAANHAPRLDFAFTERDTPALRARIQSDLGRIARFARQRDPHLHALALVGGFSRGEGSSRDGAPLNDYDLVAVRMRPGGDAEYRGTSDLLTRELGLEVDVLPIWHARLPHVARKLFWLDARLGGRVIMGDPLALERLPRFDADALPRREIARLLGNRAAGLLLALPGRAGREGVLDADLQAAKAAIAAMDATLLARDTYAARLRERLDLARGHPDHATFAHAVRWKLAPSRDPLGPAWWTEARDALLRAVDATRAASARDGLAEHLVHALRTSRPTLHPSRRVRMASWRLLAASEFPEGPRDLKRAGEAVPGGARDGDWVSLKRRFFAWRATTLQ